MHLTDKQIEQVYHCTLVQLKKRIIDKYGDLSKFSRETGINRTSIVKQFSENTAHDMSIGFYYRLSIALGIIKASDVNPALLDSLIPLKAYLMINNNTIMHSLTLIANGL